MNKTRKTIGEMVDVPKLQKFLLHIGSEEEKLVHVPKLPNFLAFCTQ
jgi:hypothetical protein